MWVPRILKNASRLQTVSLALLSRWLIPPCALWLALLDASPLLELTLLISGYYTGDEHMEPLAAALEGAQRLQTIMLHIVDNEIGESGARALSHGLGKCPFLTNLSMSLCGNGIGDTGVRALGSGLKHAHSLRSLNIRIWPAAEGDGDDTPVDRSAVADMCESLRELPKLRRLVLGLSGNKGLGNPVDDHHGLMKAMASLAQSLDYFVLKLDEINITNAELDTLAIVLASATSLKTLFISLNNNPTMSGRTMLPQPASSILLAISRTPSLVCFSVELHGCGIGDPLPVSDGFKCLQRLRLDLSSNNIGDAGASALAAAFGGAPLLSALSLDLTDNCIGDHGAQFLAKALSNKGSSLHSLAMSLSHNDAITTVGVQALQQALKPAGRFRVLILYLFGVLPNDEALFRSGGQRSCWCSWCELPGLNCDDCCHTFW